MHKKERQFYEKEARSAKIQEWRWGKEILGQIWPDQVLQTRWLGSCEIPKPEATSTSISIRLPSYMISELKVKANRLDIPYQTLIKQAIAKELAG